MKNYHKNDTSLPEEQEDSNALAREMVDRKYAYGFSTDVETEVIARGLNEDVIRLISSKKGEPDWMLEFRL
jgi:Fe-S cluster assembly protein SufB